MNTDEHLSADRPATAEPGIDPDCLFCKIVSGMIPASVVYEDDQCIAFRDINPAAPVHVLVVPRRHIQGISDAAVEDEAMIGRIHLVAAQLAEQLDPGGSGFRLVINNGPRAGQSVPHLHVHLLSGRSLTWPPG